MYPLSALVGVFGASIWDISQNHGATCRVVAQLVHYGFRSLGLL